MKTKCRKKFFIFFALITLFLSLSSCDKKEEVAKNENLRLIIKDFEMPIYPDGTNISQVILKKGLIKETSYNVKIFYPAKKVLDFYEREMAQKGFKPLIEECYKYADRTWLTYEDMTLKGNPYVAQLIALWVDNLGEKKATLIMLYFWYGNQQSIILNNNSSLKVIFQVAAHIDLGG